MTKLEELKQEVGLRMGYAVAEALIDAAQDEVWELLEKVLVKCDNGVLGRDRGKYVVSGWALRFHPQQGTTPREAVLAAAKELGIEHE